ncbi:MAG: hydroxyacylglutathione hydrolase, partial [Planctomycetaceae bacterium]
MLRGGQSLEVDRVLLATGNQPPAPLGNAGQPFEHPAYCADPWGDWWRRLPETSEDVIVLGTGLTMVDVFLTLSEMNWRGKIIAVSRNGMIPQSHFRGIEYPDFLPANPESVGLQALVELLEQHCRQIRRLGENPAIVVDRLRPHTQRIWQHLTCAEKQKFLSQYAARWNVVRHRIAQPIHQRLTEYLIDEQLRIVRGNVTGLSAAGQRVQISVTSPAGEQSTLEAGFVINCTGPQPAFSESPVPLFQNLMQRGLIQVDEMDMGIQVGANFAVRDGQGQNSEFLFAIGPLMKGSLWETTAVPELRGQAMRVAEVLVEQAELTDQQRDYRLSVTEEHVIEYHI